MQMRNAVKRAGGRASSTQTHKAIAVLDRPLHSCTAHQEMTACAPTASDAPCCTNQTLVATPRNAAPQS